MSQTELLEPSRPIMGLPSKTVGDFWRWAYSDVLCNANRSILAEYIVATALKLDNKPRIEWDSVDLRYQGKGIEVKASAYIQCWPQERLSPIRFDIAPKIPWDSVTNTFGTEKKRSSECFVFCLLKSKEQSFVDPLNLNQWEFYVTPTKILDERLRFQKSVGLRMVQSISKPVIFDDLRDEVESILNF